MIDFATELPQDSSDVYLERKKVRERDDDIITKRNEFRVSFKKTISEAAAPTINGFSSEIALTDKQKEVLYSIVFDAMSIFKIGRTSSEKIREEKQKDNTVIVDPVESGWKERIKRNGFQNIDEALKVAQDAAIVALNEMADLSASPNQQ